VARTNASGSSETITGNSKTSALTEKPGEAIAPARPQPSRRAAHRATFRSWSGAALSAPRWHDVVITPAVDRLSRDTTHLLVIAREMQRAGAGIRSLAEPFLDTTSDFAEIVFAILGVAAKLERRRILERPRAAGLMPKPRASNSGASRSSPRTSRKRPVAASKRARRSAASRAATMSVKARFRGLRPDLRGTQRPFR
jgi:hypothetical protein